MKYTIVFKNGEEQTRVVSKEEWYELKGSTEVISITPAGQPSASREYPPISDTQDEPKRKRTRRYDRGTRSS